MALSVGSPPLPVRKHAALWCSDFPPPEHYTRAAITLPTCWRYHSIIQLSRIPSLALARAFAGRIAGEHVEVFVRMDRITMG